MINIRYCKKCKKAFDIATNFEECPECREKIKHGDKSDGERQRV